MLLHKSPGSKVPHTLEFNDLQSGGLMHVGQCLPILNDFIFEFVFVSDV